MPLRSSLKNEGWEFTKEIGDEFGHVPPTPRPFEDITMPRGRQPTPGSLKREPRPIRAEETSIPQPQFYEPEKSGPPPSTSTKGDSYEGDDEIRRRRAPREVQDEIEMEDIGGYRELDNNRIPSVPVVPRLYLRPTIVDSRVKNHCTPKLIKAKRKCINCKELKDNKAILGCKTVLP